MIHSKQWHYSLHRDFQKLHSTWRSPTGFFNSTLQRVPHPEKKFYIQKTKSSSIDTTCRRQRDLWSSLQDILVIHDIQPFQAILHTSSDSTPLQHSSVRMHILHFDWFPQKLHWVPVRHYKLQTLHSSKKGRCCDISQTRHYSPE